MMDTTTIISEVTLARNASEANSIAPEWIQLIPSGERIVGADGRSFLNNSPSDIVAAFASLHTGAIPLDWEHSTEILAPEGKEAPAAGWITAIEAHSDGSIWGRVEWNDRGRTSVESREYRFVSPVFEAEKSTGRIIRLLSAALTNRPNLKLKALNTRAKEEKGMSEKIMNALGLKPDATEAQALAVVAELQAKKAQPAETKSTVPDMASWAPRAELEAVMCRAQAAEKELSELKKADAEKEMNAAIDEAVVAGKIVPASRDIYVAVCRSAGLEQFKALVATLPVLCEPSKLDGKTVEKNDKALSAEELTIINNTGVSAEQFIAARNARRV